MAVFLGWLFLGEEVDLARARGAGATIVVSVALIVVTSGAELEPRPRSAPRRRAVFAAARPVANGRARAARLRRCRSSPSSLVTAVWGVTFVQVKDAVALYPLFAFLAVRFAIASATLVLPAAPRLRTLGRAGLGAGVVLGVLLAAAFGLQTAGLERTTVSQTGFITGLYVVLTPLFALVLFRQRIGLPVWGGVALAVGGLALLAGVPAGSTEGDLLVLASTAAQALQIVIVERYAQRYDPFALTFVEMARRGRRASSRSPSRSAISACRAGGRSGARSS